MIQLILTDIEGTTTAIDFVHQTLFPYAKTHLAQYIQTHHAKPEVQACLQHVRQTVLDEHGQTIAADDLAEQITVLTHWIDIDRKHTALKALQGWIWDAGYAQRDFQSHVYDDVLPALQHWKSQHRLLGVYSSGSIHAQQQLFAHTPYGDLNPFFTYYFDTTIGGKKDAASYVAITQVVHLPAKQILFLSDVEAELQAAQLAGLKTIQLLRDGVEVNTLGIQTVTSFAEIQLDTLADVS